MILSTLSLSHFRSYKKETFRFSPTTTLITGPNTSGKTNILEAISVLSTGKSFRAEKENEMIAWQEEVGRITGVTYDTKLEVMITSGSVQGQKVPVKKYLVNGISRRLIDFLGNVRSVRFWPQDLELVIGSPSIRRRYLDMVLVQVDREYRRNLQSYERGIRQRNKLLERINEGQASRSQLLFWNQLVIKAGEYITTSRADFIEFINSYRVDPDYMMTYDKSLISEPRLLQYANEEIAAKVTLVGPHRDDFFIEKLSRGVQNRDVASYGSRGEQRLAVLFLKLAEITYIQKRVQDRPMLLLDDIFSELDSFHRKEVIDLIGLQQTVITSAEEEIPQFLKDTQSDPIAVIQLPRV